DGIRDYKVTGVQTCALPICAVDPIDPLMLSDPQTKLVLEMPLEVDGNSTVFLRVVDLPDHGQAGNRDLGIIPQNSGFYVLRNNRSEERRVGKECRCERKW